MRHYPIVSIITVTYNAEDLLEDTILNIINQDYPSTEYIVIDGDSTDNTINIINKYRDKIDIIVSEPDQGIYNAMNKAVGLATGEWVNFMNAGDSFVSRDTISQSIKELKSNTDVLFGNHIYLDSGKKELRKSDIKNIYSNITFNHQSMFYKHDLLNKYKFNEAFRIVADCEMHLRAYKDGHKFQYLDIPIANFLAGGVNSQFRLNTILEFLHALSLHIPKNHDIKETFIFKLLVQENSLSIDDKLVKNSNIFDSLKRHIERLCLVRLAKNPILKLKRYKELLNYYNSIKDIK